MPVTVEKLMDLPVILCTHDENYKPAEDVPAMVSAIMKLLDTQQSPQYLIVDTTRASIGLDDLISGASVARQQMQMSRHPNIRETLIITQSRLIELGAKGMNSATFGNIAMKVFPSLEAALSHVRIASSNPTHS